MRNGYVDTRPALTAARAAWVRELRPSLPSMLLTCVRAVRSLIPSSRAITWFECPPATKIKTSRSLSVKVEMPVGGEANDLVKSNAKAGSR